MFRRSTCGLAIAMALGLFGAWCRPAMAQQWLANPGTNNWNDDANWVGGLAPSGAGATAIFDSSTVTSLFFSADTVIGGMTFNAGAPAYDFNVATALTFSGAGIVNNSANRPTLNLVFGGPVTFLNSASAGDALLLNGDVTFANASTAANAQIDVNGALIFQDASSAGNAVITDLFGSDRVEFRDTATAANATIDFDAGAVAFLGNSTAGNAAISVSGLSILLFEDNATAGNATLTMGPVGRAEFFGNATAGNASITTGFASTLNFYGNATAGNATLTLNGFGVDFNGNSTAGDATLLNNSLIVFRGNSTGGNAAVVNAATADVDISQLNSAGTTLGSIAGEGTISLGSKTLQIGGNDASTQFSGVIRDGGAGGGTGGSLTKVGTGTLALAGSNTYTGVTTIQEGTLLITGSTTSDTTVEAGGTLAGTGTIVGDVFNGGIVDPGNAGIGTFTIDGNYTGTGGVLRIESVLGNSSSPADLLVVNGNVSGQSFVQVVNNGGLGAPTTGDGIRIVDVGGVSAANAFVLAGPVNAGAYNYQLFLGGSGDPNDWFLRSGLRPAAAAYPIVPSLAQEYGARLLGTLHRRLGAQEQLRDRADLLDEPYFNGGWGRTIGLGGEQTGGGTPFDYQLAAGQGGIDLFHDEVAGGIHHYAGVYVAGGQGRADAGGQVARLALDAASVGGYWTWYGPSDGYLDAVVQGTWYEGTATTVDGSGIRPKGAGLATSLEAGYPIRVGETFLIQPQAQMVYQTFDFQSQRDAASITSFNDNDSFRGRLGVRGARTIALRETRAGGPRLLTVGLTADSWGEFLGDNVATLTALDGSNPLSFASDMGGAWAEIGGDVTVQVTQHASLYGSGQYARGFEGDRAATMGSLGLRLNY
ncbi:Antigen 43 precursor [Planctomyces sp. SH-PL14]|nr:Antigen 43 precursor [Planctomyces sp. SH-PL14]